MTTLERSFFISGLYDGNTSIKRDQWNFCVVTGVVGLYSLTQLCFFNPIHGVQSNTHVCLCSVRPASNSLSFSLAV